MIHFRALLLLFLLLSFHSSLGEASRAAGRVLKSARPAQEMRSVEATTDDVQLNDYPKGQPNKNHTPSGHP